MIDLAGLIENIKKHRYILMLLLMILLAGTCQMYQINRDLKGLHEFDETQMRLLAKNILTYNVSARMGPVNNVDPLNGKFHYYLNHPILTEYIYAAFFMIFGSTILAGRLIAMFLFFLGTVFIYLLASRLWSRSVALWVCFFYLFFPISQYYGKFVGFGNVIMPTIYLYILFYHLWVTEKKPVYYKLMLGCFVLGCAMDWYVYFLAPLTILHYRYGLKNKNNKLIFALIWLGSLSLAAYLAINYYYTGSITAQQAQWPTNIPGITEHLGASVSFIQHALSLFSTFSLLFQTGYYGMVGGHFLLGFTLPVMLMVLYYLISYGEFQYFTGPMAYVGIIGAIYFLDGLFSPVYLYWHNLLLVFVSATIAAVCAQVASKASRLFQVLLVAAFLIFSFFNTKTLYTMSNMNLNHLMIGKVISSISSPQDGIATTDLFYSPFLEYFGQREILYDVNSPEKLSYIIGSRKIKYFVALMREYQDHLINKFPAIFLPNDWQNLPNNIVLFDIKAKGITPPNHRFNISFADKINLIDYSYKVLPYGYLLLSYSWEKTDGSPEPVMVFVHFEDKNGHIMFGQDHNIMKGYFDTTSPGYGAVKESYIIQIPDMPSVNKLSVYIGLYDPQTQQRVRALNRQTADGRVLLGQIYLQREQ